MSTSAGRREALTLEGPAGRLEALLEEPKDLSANAVAVLCHPHPQFHGTMLNKVVHTLGRAASGLGAPSVRFNFRGVGASEGEYAQGLGEVEDTLAVIDWARTRYPGAALWLAGFSFGSMVSMRAAVTAQPDCLVSIAPPAPRVASFLEGEQPNCPWLIVQGDADEVCDCEAVVSWVNSLAPGPELIVLPGVSHFFHGRLTLLRETVSEFLNGASA
jgi:alpha/beta superfamily hydrolase